MVITTIPPPTPQQLWGIMWCMYYREGFKTGNINQIYKGYSYQKLMSRQDIQKKVANHGKNGSFTYIEWNDHT